MVAVADAVAAALGGQEHAMAALAAHPKVLRSRAADDVALTAEAFAEAYNDAARAAKVLSEHPSLLSTPAETVSAANAWLVGNFGYLQMQELIKGDPYVLAQTQEAMAAMTPGGTEDPERGVWAEDAVVARDGVGRKPNDQKERERQKAKEEEASAAAARAMLDPNSVPAKRSRELTQLKMADLKSLARLYGIKVSGKKSEVVARLVGYELTDEGAMRMEEIANATRAASTESDVQRARPLEDGERPEAASTGGGGPRYRMGMSPLEARFDGKPFDAARMMESLEVIIEKSAKSRAIGMSKGARFALTLSSLAYRASDEDVRELAESCTEAVSKDTVALGELVSAEAPVTVKFVRVERDQRTKRKTGKAKVVVESQNPALADAVATEMQTRRLHGRRVHVASIEAQMSAGAFEDPDEERAARCVALSEALSKTFDDLVMQVSPDEGGYAAFPFDVRTVRVEIDFVAGRLLVAGRRHDRVTDEIVAESNETERALALLAASTHGRALSSKHQLVRAYHNAMDNQVRKRMDRELEKVRKATNEYLGAYDSLVGSVVRARCVGFVDGETRRVEKLAYGTWRFTKDKSQDWRESWMPDTKGRLAAGILFDVMTPPPTKDGTPPPVRLPRAFLKRSSFTRSMRFAPGETYQMMMTGTFSGARSAPLNLTQRGEDYAVALLERYMPELERGIVEVVDVGRFEGVLTKIVLAPGPNAEKALEEMPAFVDKKYELARTENAVQGVLSKVGDIVRAMSTDMHQEIIDLVQFYENREDQLLALLRLDPGTRFTDLTVDGDDEGRLVVSEEECKGMLRGGGAHLKLAERLTGVNLRLEVDHDRVNASWGNSTRRRESAR